jgi:hypothetical protein
MTRPHTFKKALAALVRAHEREIADHKCGLQLLLELIEKLKADVAELRAKLEENNHGR